MNKKQKFTLLTGIAILVIMSIVPPWTAEQQITYKFAKKVMGDDLKPDDPSMYPKYGQVIKYRFVLNRPWPFLYDEPDPATGEKSGKFEINYGLLGLQWTVIILSTGYIFLEYKNKKAR